jgi:hypothetical protein
MVFVLKFKEEPGPVRPGTGGEAAAPARPTRGGRARMVYHYFVQRGRSRAPFAARAVLAPAAPRVLVRGPGAAEPQTKEP